MQLPHTSVLLQEVLDAFQEKKLDVFVDGTLGAGGHSLAILQHHPEVKHLIGIDQDPAAMHIAEERLEKFAGKFHAIPGNFADFDRTLDELGIGEIDGMLIDLGVSSMQLDRGERGFSFMQEGPLDMRMDPQGDLTAQEIVNTWSQKELGDIFREFGEEKRWRKAAEAIVAARAKKPLETTRELVALLRPVLEVGKRREMHPLTLVFQALRIAVNRELERLEEVIPKAIARLVKGGRLAMISFHSLEDRIVKNAFRYAADDKENTSGIGGVFLTKERQVSLVTKKAIVPGDEEMKQNPRSRSAKLRVVEKR